MRRVLLVKSDAYIISFGNSKFYYLCDKPVIYLISLFKSICANKCITVSIPYSIDQSIYVLLSISSYNT